MNRNTCPGSCPSLRPFRSSIYQIRNYALVQTNAITRLAILVVQRLDYHHQILYFMNLERVLLFTFCCPRSPSHSRNVQFCFQNGRGIYQIHRLGLQSLNQKTPLV
jgi:hypothetical protein